MVLLPSSNEAKETIRTNGGRCNVVVDSDRSTLLTHSSNSVESTFPGWLDTFYSAIDPLFPAEESLANLSLSDVPPPRIRLAPVDGSTAYDHEPPKWAKDVRWAKLKEMERVTKEGWYQDVRGIELEVETSGSEALYVTSAFGD